ncbi:MAG: hypothetical protein FWC73_12600 [Defluviitaleaceae bacterium]|nr:hypothetical protein [Defluviitaleaceae bacterium]
MNLRAFYRRQRGPNIFYFLGLGFFALMVLGCIGAMVLLYMEYGPGIDLLLMGLAILGFAGFFLGFFLYIKIVLGRRRRKIYQKYEELSDNEKKEVSGELGRKFVSVLWGEKRVYTRSNFFLEFIDYDQMVWFYPCNNVIPVVASYEGVSIDGQINALSVHVYDNEGTRYKIPAASTYDTGVVVEEILQRAPGILYGYNKKLAKLAKKDFQEFLLEAEKIQEV